MLWQMLKQRCLRQRRMHLQIELLRSILPVQRYYQFNKAYPIPHLDQLPSRTIYYLAIFAGLAIIIGGVFYYVKYLKDNMQKLPSISGDDNPVSIIGTDPEPQRRGRYQ